MNNNDVLRARNSYCVGRSCDNCLFHTYARDKFNIHCDELTTEQIYDVLSIIKEEKSMTKKEIQKEIDKTQKQLVELYKALEEAKNEVPETLDINEGDKYDYVNSDGGICWTCYNTQDDIDRVRKRRAFLSEEYARMFADKTQFIADMMHFKWLYDRDYKPNWDSENSGRKFCIYYNNKTKKFEWSFFTGYSHSIETVYFSSGELAERCAEWLNKKYGNTKE